MAHHLPPTPFLNGGSAQPAATQQRLLISRHASVPLGRPPRRRHCPHAAAPALWLPGGGPAGARTLPPVPPPSTSPPPVPEPP
ncbi:Os04g0290875 [Oryza sativa Japonica Group]|uniref:Os04g0290875 protein n=1 Tax=Oryza sativa subsp. japonica TaxID=39947 RepID=A0A0P0W830_ORYSJ|nr:Os04g0290875 [Oryza sativa Japonica Group]